MSEIRIAIAFPPWSTENGGMRSLMMSTVNYPSLEELGLCGACHLWGADPVLRPETLRCNSCERSEAEIREAHGVCFLAELLVPDVIV